MSSPSVQLYSVRDAVDENVDAALARLAEIHRGADRGNVAGGEAGGEACHQRCSFFERCPCGERPPATIIA